MEVLTWSHPGARGASTSVLAVDKAEDGADFLDVFGVVPHRATTGDCY